MKTPHYLKLYGNEIWNKFVINRICKISKNDFVYPECLISPMIIPGKVIMLTSTNGL